MLLFKHYLIRPVDAVLKAGVALFTEITEWKGGCLTSFFEILDYLLKLFSLEKHCNSDFRYPKFQVRKLDGRRHCATTFEEDVEV